MNINSDTAIIYSTEALSLARKVKWKKGEAQSLHQLGVFYSDKGDYTLSLNYYHKALRLWEELIVSSDKFLTLAGKIGKSTTIN